MPSSFPFSVRGMAPRTEHWQNHPPDSQAEAVAFSARRGSRWKSRGTNGASRIPSRSVIHHPEEPPMLISHSSLLLFVAGAAVLLVIPGPAVTYVVSRTIGHGRAAGLVSVLGIV